MNPKNFAAVTISFRRKLSEQDLQDIENKLREYDHVSSFSQSPHEISFHIGADDKIDYGVVVEFKRFLKEKQKKAPKVTVVEYVKRREKSF
jgi:biopolymer transport protein ExbD